MVYILMIAFIIAIAIVFGYILWNLKDDIEFLEDYICYIGDAVTELENEIENLKKEGETK